MRPELPEPPLVASFAIATGGSTGQPKVILSPFPGTFVPSDTAPDEALTGRRPDMIQLVNGPLYHNSPCTLTYGGLLWGHQLILMQRFDADLALDLVERHRVSFVPTVPTVMKRMLDAQRRRPRDLSSIEALFHTGASCPASVKRGWIELIGAARVYEAFGGSELIGSTFIRGDEWLTHPGSVGRPIGADLLILDSTGAAVPPGDVGEIFMRTHRQGPGYQYLNHASPSRRSDGFESLGDLGWLARTATSTSPIGASTSSSPAVRTCIRRRSRTCCSITQRFATRSSSASPMTNGESASTPSCAPTTRG